jgi:HK97 family phage major capsid protein
MSTAVLRRQVEEMRAKAKELYAELEREENADTRHTLNQLIDDGLKKQAELELAVKAEAFVKAAEAPRSPEAPVTESVAADTLGGEYIKQRSAAANPEQHYKATVSGSQLVRTLLSKALHSGATSAGAMTDNQYIAEPYVMPQRPTSVLNAISIGQTSSDAIDYVVQTSETLNAAPTAEFTATAGTSGAKPESDMAFELRTATVRTIPHFVAESRQIMMDAPRLAQVINNRLLYGLTKVLEDQIVNGNGTAPNLTGILNTTGLLVRTMSTTAPVGRGQTTTDTQMTSIRKAITDIALNFFTPELVMMRPENLESLELAEYTGNRYMNAFDPVASRIWRVPVVSSLALPTNTALVGSFREACELWYREQATIRTSEHHAEFFTRNAIAILAELRAAFAVVYPTAIERVNLI